MKVTIRIQFRTEYVGTSEIEADYRVDVYPEELDVLEKAVAVQAALSILSDASALMARSAARGIGGPE